MDKDQSQPASKQDEDREARLKEALSRPGIRQLLEVYGPWDRYIRDLYSGRKITEKDRSQPASKQDEDYDAELEKP